VRIPEIELLWWEGCPSTDKARAELRGALADLGLDGAEIREREIETDADAEAAGFIGSPTILIDGEDVYPAPDEPAALNCRIYRRRDGRLAPTPDPDDLREVLRRATERLEVKR
jgi:hypothetical protein